MSCTGETADELVEQNAQRECIVWLDLEMTSTDQKIDAIMECAAVITNGAMDVELARQNWCVRMVLRVCATGISPHCMNTMSRGK